MGTRDEFQGVVLFHTGGNIDVRKILGCEQTSVHRGIECHDLELKNKYYQGTVYLIEYDSLSNKADELELLKDCHAIIISIDGKTMTTEELDAKIKLLNPVQGSIRVLLCDGIDENSNPYPTLIEWSLKNEYELLLTSEEDLRDQLINSLSAYKWPHRSDVSPANVNNTHEREPPQLSGDVLKQLMDFDSLLGKINAYRNQPEPRGNPNDKNLEEIAEILSNFLGDDVDKFLENEASSSSS